MSISNLEDKLYHTNFKSNDSRIKAYLAVHATLLKHKEIPRCFIPNNIQDNKNLESILNTILFSEINLITENTNKNLSELNITTKSINDLTPDHKNELMSMIEDLLYNGWGSGKIHYEYLRVLPQNSCELLKTLESLNSDDTKIQTLISILRKRESESLLFQQEMNKFFSPGERKYHPTVLAKSYQLLIEKQWRNNWSHSSNYLLNDLKTVSGIIFLEDL